MSSKIESIYPVPIAPGWSAHVCADKNSAGNFVVTELKIFPTSDESRDEGLTSSVIRKISLNQLFQVVQKDYRDIDIEYLLDVPDENAQIVRSRWLKEISGPWPRKGRNSHDVSLYAKTAFFYVAELRENPNAPLVTLAEKLKVNRETVARRIDKARQLGLLTSPVKKTLAAGKPGGTLTDEAKALLELTNNGETK